MAGVNNATKPYYYQTNDKTFIGVLPALDKYDYFGYFKKMLLTLFNLTMINNNVLPIHGAGLSIHLRNGITKNVVILGDSGAGKSETIEAMKHLNDHLIADITTIYDDMGSFIKENANTDNIKSFAVFLSFMYEVNLEEVLAIGGIDLFKNIMSVLDIKCLGYLIDALDNFDGKITYFDELLPELKDQPIRKNRVLLKRKINETFL